MMREVLSMALVVSLVCRIRAEDGGIAEKLSAIPDMPGSMDKPGYSERWGLGVYGCTSAYLNTSYIDENGEFQSDFKELAKFGECVENDAYGLLVHATFRQRTNGPNAEEVEDHTGCRLPLVEGPLPTEPWIALIKRGGCKFQTKVENALYSNATAVIVYDDKQSISLQKMQLTSTTRNISAVFTYKWKGESLAQLIADGNTVHVGITVGNPCDRPYNLNSDSGRVKDSRSFNYNSNRNFESKKLPIIPSLTLVICSADLAPDSKCLTVTSVLFVSVSFIVLLVISLAWLIFYYVQRFRYIHAKDRLSRRLCSAAKKALSKIPTKNIKADDNELQGDGECCAICIEPFKVSDVLRLLPCKHEFHKSCIDPWLLDQRTCPMCKMDILKHYGFVFTGSQESILHLEVEEGTVDNQDSRTTSPVPQPLTPEPEEVSVRPTQDTQSQVASVHQRSVEVSDPPVTSPSSTKLEFEQEVSTPSSVAVLPRQESSESTTK